MSKTLTASEAKAQFDEALRDAEAGDSVVITRRGRPIAAIVPIGDLTELTRGKGADPSRGLAGIAGGWHGSEELVEQLEKLRRSRQAPRS